MSKKHRMDWPIQQPDVKRRKTDLGSSGDAWGDEDFSQAELDNIDTIIASQQPSTRPLSNINNNITKSSNRAIGRGASRSYSAGEVYRSTNDQSSTVTTHKLASKSRTKGKLPSSALGSSSSKTEKHTDKERSSSVDRWQVTSPAPALSASGQFSPSMPGDNAAAADGGQKLLEEINTLHQENKKLKKQQYSSEGQVKILYQSIQKKDLEINKFRQDKASRDEQVAHEKSEKLIKLERENDRLKTELQFKEQENLELQRNVKRNEDRQGQLTPSQTQNPNLRSPQPTRSNKKLFSPVTPKNNFPTRQTFSADECSPKKCRDEATQSSSMETLTAPEMRIHAARKMLVLTQTKPGEISGPRLLGKLLSKAARSDSLLPLLQTTDTKHQKHTDKKSLTSQCLPPVAVVNAENELLAQQAITSLLNSSAQIDSTLLLLPLIEEHITHFIDSLTRSPSTTTGSSSCSSVSSLESTFQSALTLDHETHALEALYKLRVLVQYSSDVSAALVAKAGSIDTPINKSGSNSEASSRSGTPLPPSCRSRIISSCRLFEQLVQLADPEHIVGKAMPAAVIEASLHVLVCLAKSRPVDQLDIFSVLLPPDGTVIANCLNAPKPSQLVAILDLLIALVPRRRLLNSLCLHSGECIMLNVYHCCVAIPTSYSSQQRTEIKHKLILLLSSISSHHGCHTLLSNCDCGQQVVKCVVLSLHSELPTSTLPPSLLPSTSTAPSIAHSTVSSQSAVSSSTLSFSVESLMHAGLRLLHALSQFYPEYRQRHLDVENQYVQLLFAYADMISAEDDVSKGLLSDLWDFNHALPWEEEEDMDGS